MPAPAIDIWHPEPVRVAAAGRPQPWANVVGRVHCDSSPVYTAGYKCNDGPFTPLVLGPSAYRLRHPGDFNIELDFDTLSPGPNTVSIWASNHAGEVTQRDVIVEYVAHDACPLPLDIHWQDVAAIHDVGQIVDGQWRLTDAGPRPVSLAYDRVLVVGDMTWSDYTATAVVTIHGYETTPAIYGWPSYGPAVGLLMGWRGHAQWGDMVPRRGWHPFGSLAFLRWQKDGQPMCKQLWAGVASDQIAPPVPTPDPDLDRPYIYKVQSRTQPGKPNHFAMKMYPADTPEPADWDLAGTAAPESHTHGSLALVAHHTDATFGDIHVEPI
ncbi:MAG: hypothetical protein WD009_11410 [Phycisphaeraceae bacterium]